MDNNGFAPVKRMKNKIVYVLKKSFTSLHKFMYRLSTVRLILFSTLIMITITFITSFLFAKYRIEGSDINPDGFVVNIDVIYNYVIYSPLLETLLFQMIPLIIFSKYKKGNVLPIIVSAMLFGLLHYFANSHNIIKFIDTFLKGIVLAYVYTLCQKKEKKPFLITSTIHGLFNLLAFIPTLIIQLIKN